MLLEQVPNRHHLAAPLHPNDPGYGVKVIGLIFVRRLWWHWRRARRSACSLGWCVRRTREPIARHRRRGCIRLRPRWKDVTLHCGLQQMPGGCKLSFSKLVPGAHAREWNDDSQVPIARTVSGDNLFSARC